MVEKSSAYRWITLPIYKFVTEINRIPLHGVTASFAKTSILMAGLDPKCQLKDVVRHSPCQGQENIPLARVATH
jgi:hypothetical protein